MQIRRFGRKAWRKCRSVVKKQRCLRVVVLLIGGLWGLPALYMVLFTPPRPPVNLPSIQQLQQPVYNLYVSNWGFHTAIILEQPQGWRLGPLNHPEARYVEYGWGDQHFFMESDRSLLTVLAAGIIPTDSVMYLRGSDQLPNAQIGPLYYRSVTRQQLYDLIQSLEQGFKRQQGNRKMPFPEVPEFVGQFYPGREYYTIWSDCNAWTIRHLQDINVAHSAIPVVFAEQVGPSLKGFERLQGGN